MNWWMRFVVFISGSWGAKPLTSVTEARLAMSCRKMRVKGGLTCIWQVSGRSDVDFEDWMRMDCRYAKRRTIWFDLSLLFRTIGAVLRAKGAY